MKHLVEFENTELSQELKEIYLFAQSVYSDICDMIAQAPSDRNDSPESEGKIQALTVDFLLVIEKANLLTSELGERLNPEDSIRLAKLVFAQSAYQNLKNFGEMADCFNFKDKCAQYLDNLDDSYEFPDYNHLSSGAHLNAEETLLAAAHIYTYARMSGSRASLDPGYINHLNDLMYSLNREYIPGPLFHQVEAELTALKDSMHSPPDFPKAFRSN